MIRSMQRIMVQAGRVKNEAENLPDESYAGEDNSEMIEYLHEVARQLYEGAGGHSEEVTNPEVSAWINGEPSELDVYDE